MKQFPLEAVPETGFIPDFIDYLKDFSTTPVQYSYFTAVTILGLVMGRQVKFEAGDAEIYPNFFIALLGKPSQFKSTPFKTGEKLLRTFQQGQNVKMLIPEDNSNESFKSWIVDNPRGLYPMDEMSQWIKLGNKQFADEIKTLLIKLYDCPDTYPINRQATGVRYVPNPFISAYATSTFDLLSENSKESDLSSGFFSRFLWIPSWTTDKPIPLQPPHDKLKKMHLDKFLAGLSARVNSAHHGKGMDILMTDEAYEVYVRWFEKWYIFRDSMDYRLIDLVSKLPQIVLKVAMVIHASNTEDCRMSRCAMLKAGIAMNWVLESYQYINHEFSFGETEKNVNKIIRIIRDKGGEISRTVLAQNSHMKKKVLDEIIETLIDSEQIERIKGEKTIYRLKIANLAAKSC